jgi:4-hydroxybenzoyl-CoA reductase subunit beta
MIEEKRYLQPRSIAETIAMADAQQSDFRFIAGGTDLMVNKFQENENSSCLIDLFGVEELKEITSDEGFLYIGALTTLDELKKHPLIVQQFKVLIEAAEAVATPVIRKTATLGGNILCENRCIFYNQSKWWRDAVGNCLKCEGNICIATGSKKHCYSEFVSDTAIALISMDAMIEFVDHNGSHKIALHKIFSGDGVHPVNLNKSSLIKSIILPLNQNFKSVFYKLRLRESMDFTSLTTVVTKNKEGKWNIVLGGVDPKPVLIHGNKESDHAELIQQALKNSRAIDNEVFSRKYRRKMIQVYLKRSFDIIEKTQY